MMMPPIQKIIGYDDCHRAPVRRGQRDRVLPDVVHSMRRHHGRVVVLLPWESMRRVPSMYRVIHSPFDRGCLGGVSHALLQSG